jgi:hypothetical protein
MSKKYQNVLKMSSPGTSKEPDYVVNIYKNGNFMMAYRYRNWNINDVENEVKLLKIRFPEYKGWNVSY